MKVRCSGEGQEGQIQAKSSSENEKFKDLDLRSTLFWSFFWLLWGQDMSDESKMGWYDSSMVRGGQDFQVDSEDYRDYRGDYREYFNESKV